VEERQGKDYPGEDGDASHAGNDADMDFSVVGLIDDPVSDRDATNDRRQERGHETGQCEGFTARPKNTAIKHFVYPNLNLSFRGPVRRSLRAIIVQIENKTLNPDFFADSS